MSRISQESRERVLAATDILALISSCIEVKRAGSSYKARCPFHQEKSPSFHINVSRQSFKCFGCGEGGDAISFEMKYKGLSFVEALRSLASRANIQLEEADADPAADRSRRLRSRLLQLHREAAEWFHDRWRLDPHAQHARDYFHRRGYDDRVAAEWKIGWMPEDPTAFLSWAKTQHYTGRELIESGIAALRDENNPRSGLYVRFRNRLMFPVCNAQGEVIAFSGRQLQADPNSGKYVNSPETSLFLKSKTLFALDRAKRSILKQRVALLCEGQLDVIACHQHGVTTAIAPLGTAFTSHHAVVLKQYADAVVLCFDADAAGYKACERAFIELAPQNLSVRVAMLPPGEDPDSLLKQHGAAHFQEIIASSPSFFDFKLDRALHTGGLAHAEARSQTAQEIIPLLNLIEDPIKLDGLLMHCATRLQIDPAVLRQATVSYQKRIRLQHQQRKQNAEVAVRSVDPTTPAPEEALTKPARPRVDSNLAYLAHLGLYHMNVRYYLGEQLETLHEIAQHIEGVSLVEAVINCAAAPDQPAAINAFCSTLPAELREALMEDTTFHDSVASEALSHAEAVLSKLSARALLMRQSQLTHALEDPQLSHERMIELLSEIEQLKPMLANLDSRIIADDRVSLAPARSPRPQRPPFDREKWLKWKQSQNG